MVPFLRAAQILIFVGGRDGENSENFFLDPLRINKADTSKSYEYALPTKGEKCSPSVSLFS